MSENKKCDEKLIYGANQLCKDDGCGSINELPCYAGTLRSRRKTESSTFILDVMLVFVVPFVHASMHRLQAADRAGARC